MELLNFYFTKYNNPLRLLLTVAHLVTIALLCQYILHEAGYPAIVPLDIKLANFFTFILSG
ncbi:hypothetical protein [Asinibacterium sp. OR53]|uniref:hypothetical protein n=1 Tax=Asinibacterium sp. OR53 TaxID=925409 RepID=UPI0004AE6C32|nr:hypothetical protein [Asinibacterium sp. OR53]